MPFEGSDWYTVRLVSTRDVCPLLISTCEIVNPTTYEVVEQRRTASKMFIRVSSTKKASNSACTATDPSMRTSMAALNHAPFPCHIASHAT